MMKSVHSRLRKSGHTSIYYLDDSLLIATSKEECQLNVDATVELLQKCGFAISWSKSVLKPTSL